MLGLRKRPRDRRRLVYRQPTAAEIASMPFEEPERLREPEPDAVQIIPRQSRAPRRKEPSFKSRFGRTSIVGNPGAKAGQICGFNGCSGTIMNLDGCFTVCNNCGNLEERTR